MARDKGRTYDGISRPTNKKYEENWNAIFGKKNPMAKEVRTPKYKPKVVKPKKGKGSFKRNKEPDEGWSGIV
jgi:alternative ribosome-rescue factor